MILIILPDYILETVHNNYRDHYNSLDKMYCILCEVMYYLK